jgi:DNA (cytosine-5)-methyltransferase 1
MNGQEAHDLGVRRMNPKPDKPPYWVPSMDEIGALTPNGIKVISTFSGCGGSSLGYRMAGCTVLGASEFVPAAYEVYRLNASPQTIIWTDDIREMSGLDMLRDVGLGVGELDILDGSPPCSAFSTAGKRSEGWGQVNKYSDTAQRVDDLFYEYARILKQMQPRAFIAENVEGLVKGTAKGYFKRIYAALEACGYVVRAAVLDASWLGVPQARRRLIFYGLRNDLRQVPKHPEPLPYRYVLGDALGDFSIRAARRTSSANRLPMDEPMPTITTQTDEWWMLDQSVTDPETQQRLTRNWGAEQYERLLRAMFDDETGTHIGISRYAIGPEWLKTAEGHSSDRYFSLQRSSLTKPSPTVTATAGSIGAAGVTHPYQPRKFNLVELRRICGFPDDFALSGSYEQRAERLGRSVPPVMMKHIAQAVCRQLEKS